MNQTIVSNTTLFGELALIILAAKLFGLAARRFKVPQVVGELVAGLVIGPSMLGLVSENVFLNNAAEIGVVLLMFYAGLQTNIDDLKKAGLKSFVIATFGVMFPLLCGTVLYMMFYGFSGFGTKEFNEALFIGTILTATSVTITVATLRELGKLKGKIGTVIVSAAIIDDVIGIIVLTVVMNLTGGNSTGISGVMFTILKTIIFFGLSFVVGIIISHLFKLLDVKHPKTQRIAIYGLALCFFMAWAAEKFFGVADITGAYCAGVMLCMIPDRDYVGKKVDQANYMFFGSIFFASIGIKTNLAGFSFSLLWFTLALIVIALLSKLIGCGLISRVLGFNKKEAISIGLGMMTRGEVALIVAQKAVQSGSLTSTYMASIILLIVVSSIVTPIALKLSFKGHVEEPMIKNA